MYHKHFAFTAWPFDRALEPEKLFPSTTITEAQTKLQHLLELRAIGLVTGQAGSGKTTVCRKIVASLHPGLYRVFYLSLSTGNLMDRHTNPSVGNSACPPNAIGQPHSVPSASKLLH